jgi:hypothetical protein
MQADEVMEKGIFFFSQARKRRAKSNPSPRV